MATLRFFRHPLLALIVFLPLLLVPTAAAFAADKAPPDLLVKINLPIEWPENSAPKGLTSPAGIERSTDLAIAEFHAKLVEYANLGFLPGGSCTHSLGAGSVLARSTGSGP